MIARVGEYWNQMVENGRTFRMEGVDQQAVVAVEEVGFVDPHTETEAVQVVVASTNMTGAAVAAAVVAAAANAIVIARK